MSCRLMKLPAELRVIIYEFVFSPDHSKDEEVEICKQHGPYGDLLATCSEIQGEAQSAYDTAVELFFETSFRYFVTVDAEAIGDEGGLINITGYAGPPNLPRAKSLRVGFALESYPDFYLRFEIVDNKPKV